MNTILTQWINNLWRHGAIELDQRDEFKYRLNVQREDFDIIVRDLNHYIQYMSAGYQKKWTALLAKDFPAITQ